MEVNMSFKDNFSKEKTDLLKFKKAYETVAFFALMVLIFQQLFFLVVNIINYSKFGFFSTANFVSANLQAFVSRIVGINNTSVIFMIFGILAWLGYYALLYLVVFVPAHKRNMSKWTWTLYVAFGPTILFIPAYIWFILYLFRTPIINTVKKVVEEYKTHKVEENNIEEVKEEKNE